MRNALLYRSGWGRGDEADLYKGGSFQIVRK
jgi:hypothetical protein